MDNLKLDILFAQFCYAGNGGVATVLPDYVPWFARVSSDLANDDTVGRVAIRQYGDIPLAMERNRVVADAKRDGYDVIVMLDSDNIPDLYLGKRSGALPFIETSYRFLHDRAKRGVPTVVCAPYCGPPPHPTKGGQENVYVFYATEDETEDEIHGVHRHSPDGTPVHNVKFEPYSREHAPMMTGIQPIAAGPTGCIMYSTDAFDLMPVHGRTDEEILEDHAKGRITSERAMQLLRMESWFFYEYTDSQQTRKASTEDVTNTREIQFAGIEKHGEPVLFCNWDAWAGHMKPKCVGAPAPLRLENVSRIFAEAVRSNKSATERTVELVLD